MKLTEYLPQCYENSPEVNDWQNALQLPVQELWTARDDFLLQLDIITATWGLVLWEKMYGIVTDTKKQYDYRRTRIIAKIRGQGTATPQMLVNLASSFTNAEVTILEYPKGYHFNIKFVGKLGIPPNLDDLTAAVNEVKPAHLTFGYAYSFITVGQLCSITLAELERQRLDAFAFAEITLKQLEGMTLAELETQQSNNFIF
ncbi:MAG: putative phage tail protein [Hydrogenoanaerobacterium sp.]